ncbi:MAG TPA: uracil-DNA glycosylase family protein [Candidatus Dormibacteraeota bacterium]|nr:uracil-DNA glycosylase family protein [Candidatus Dormibacteraeota bacterium]
MSEIYLTLVRDRKECRLCEPLGLTNPAVCGDGLYDSDHIGPWSKWHGNLNAELMVVGQDWGDTTAYIGHRGIEDPQNATNKVLVGLVRSVGLDMDAVFLTNAVLCLKEGGCQAPVNKEWFRNCGERFLKPTIEIVKPRVLVTLGEHAYRSVALLFGVLPALFNQAVNYPKGFMLPQGTLFFPMYHCGARILNTYRNLDKQKEDWLRVKRALQHSPT